MRSTLMQLSLFISAIKGKDVECDEPNQIILRGFPNETVCNGIFNLQSSQTYIENDHVSMWIEFNDAGPRLAIRDATSYNLWLRCICAAPNWEAGQPYPIYNCTNWTNWTAYGNDNRIVELKDSIITVEVSCPTPVPKTPKPATPAPKTPKPATPAPKTPKPATPAPKKQKTPNPTAGPTMKSAAKSSLWSNKTYLYIAAAVALIVIAFIAFCVYKCKYSANAETNERNLNDIESVEYLLNQSDEQETDIEAGYGQSNVESSSSNEEVECVQLKFTTKGRGQDIEEVHEELLDEMMKIDEFKSKVYEKTIEVKNEKKGEMKFVLLQEEETAMDDQSDVIELLKNEKRVKHLEFFGMEETATVPKKKKKRRSKRKKSKKVRAKAKEEEEEEEEQEEEEEERRSSIYKYGLNQIGKPWISIERQKEIQKLKWKATGKKGRWQDTRIW